MNYKQATVFCDYPMQHCMRMIEVTFTGIYEASDDASVVQKLLAGSAIVTWEPDKTKSSSTGTDYVPLHSLYLDSQRLKRFVPEEIV